MSTIKIAIVVSKFPVISETFILNQITGLIDRGYEIEILTFEVDEDSTYHNAVKEYNLMDKVYDLNNNMPKSLFKRYLNIIPTIIKNLNKFSLKELIESLNFVKNGRRVFSLKYLYALLQRVNQKKYDILHCQFGHIGVAAMILKKLNIIDGNIITSFRGIDITRALPRNRVIYQELYEEGHVFLPVCNYFKKILIEEGCAKEKINVHYSGIDTTKFTLQFKEESDETIQILSTARLVEKKGLKYAIKAISKLHKHGKEINYTIIGDGPLEEELTSLIRKLNASSYIKLVGKKTHEEIQNYLNITDLFLAPSVTADNGDREGIPNSIKEAMLMKIPVISTMHSGIPELIKEGITGYLVPEKDSVALYKKINYALKNSEINKDIIENAYKTIISDFNIKILNDELEKIYIKLLCV